MEQAAFGVSAGREVGRSFSFGLLAMQNNLWPKQPLEAQFLQLNSHLPFKLLEFFFSFFVVFDTFSFFLPDSSFCQFFQLN